MDSFFSLLQAVAVALQIVLVVLLCFGHVRRYPAIFLYAFVYLTTSLVEGYVNIYRPDLIRAATYRQLYFADQVFIDFIQYGIVIALTYQALPANSPLRQFAGKAFGLIVSLSVILPFILFREHKVFRSTWFKQASELLVFGVALANLVLWTALATNKKRDPQVLAVAIGLGVSLAGEGLAWGARVLFHMANTGDALDTLTFILSLAILCKAFWPKSKPATESPA